MAGKTSSAKKKSEGSHDHCLDFPNGNSRQQKGPKKEYKKYMKNLVVQLDPREVQDSGSPDLIRPVNKMRKTDPFLMRTKQAFRQSVSPKTPVSRISSATKAKVKQSTESSQKHVISSSSVSSSGSSSSVEDLSSGKKAQPNIERTLQRIKLLHDSISSNLSLPENAENHLLAECCENSREIYKEVKDLGDSLREKSDKIISYELQISNILKNISGRLMENLENKIEEKVAPFLNNLVCDLSSKLEDKLEEKFCSLDEKFSETRKAFEAKIFKRLEKQQEEVSNSLNMFLEQRAKDSVDLLESTAVNLQEGMRESLAVLSNVASPYSIWHKEKEFPRKKYSEILKKEREEVKKTVRIVAKNKEDLSEEVINNLQIMKFNKDVTIKKIKRNKRFMEISCKKKEEIDNIKQLLREEKGMEEKIEFEERDIVKQKIIIFGVPENESEEDLSSILAGQLGEDSEDLELYFESFFGQRPGVVNWIVEAPKHIARALVRERFMYCRFRSCRIRAYAQTSRCFSCQDFGHWSRSCTQQGSWCGKCAGKHRTKDCTSDLVECINCLSANKNDNTSFQTDHEASSNRCPCYKLEKSKLIESLEAEAFAESAD